MKKNTTSSFFLGKCYQLYASIVLVALFLTPALFAEDVLLGQFEFTTGANQTKPTSVTAGLTFSDIIINSAKVTSNYTGDAVETSNWGTTFNVNTGRCVQFSVTKDATLSEFNVSRVDVTYKRAVAATKKMQLNAAAFLNPNTLKPFSADVAYVGPGFEVCSMTEALQAIPAVTDATPQYLAVASQATATTDVVTIDKIEIYGTVTANLSPSIVPDVASKILDASKGSSRSFPVHLYGANITNATTLSIVGTDAGYFQIDKSSVTAVDMNAAAQTVNVTYAASTLTYDLATRVHVPHTAILRIENPDVTTIDIPITATTSLLMEDFSNYNDVALSTSVAADIPAYPDNIPLTLAPGWTGNKMYAYRASTPNLATVCLIPSASDSAYITTPQMDLTQPFNISFKARSLVNGSSDGRFVVYLDGTQLINSGQQTNSTLSSKISKAFVGTATSKLTISGFMVEANQMIIDTIVVNYSAEPALNIPLNKEEDFGLTVPGNEKTVNIPIRGYNLTGDLTLSLLSGTNFIISSETTIPQATATAGTTIAVKFIAPVTTGDYTETLTVATTDFTSRTIILKATSDYGTGTATINKGKIIVNDSGLELTGYAGANVVVYNLAGISIGEYSNVVDSQLIRLNEKGCYMLKIEDGNARIVKKIIIR